MKPNANPHHLVLGELKDFLSGLVISDTHDERYRQKIVRMLVLENKFVKNDVLANINIEILTGGKKARVKIDFLISHQEKIVALIKYAPGSLVTRRLSTLALSRLIRPYQIPFVIITNGEDAEIMDGDSGKIIATGFKNIPNKEMIIKNWSSFSFKPIQDKIFDQASKIAFACEVDGACPCDSDVCILE